MCLFVLLYSVLFIGSTAMLETLLVVCMLAETLWRVLPSCVQ